MSDGVTRANSEIIAGEEGLDLLVGQASTNVEITAPISGETKTITLAKGDVATLSFDATAATPVLEGNDFVLTFDSNGDGSADSRIVFQNLVEEAQGDNAPVLVIGGVELSAGLLIGQAQALAEGETLETAAGAGAGPQGGGGSVYSDDFGDILDGLSGQSGLQGTLADLIAALAGGDGFSDTAAGIFTVEFLTLGTQVDSVNGGIEARDYDGGFEDWAPNQHVGEDGAAPMQVAFDFAPEDNETLDSIVIQESSENAVLYIGGFEDSNIFNGPFPVTITPDNFDQIYIKPDVNSDVDITLDVTANISDPDTGEVATIPVTVVAVIDAAADQAVFNNDLSDQSGLDEEALVEIPVNITFDDFLDGSETQEIVISGIPADWVLNIDGTFGPNSGVTYTENTSGNFVTYTLNVTSYVTTSNGTVDVNVTFDPKDWTSQRLDDGTEHKDGAAEIIITANTNETNQSGEDLSAENDASTISQKLTIDIAEDGPTVKNTAIALDETDGLQTNAEKRVENGNHTARVDAGQADVDAALTAAGLTAGKPVSSGYRKVNNRIDMESDGTTDANPADVDGQESIQFTAYNGQDSGLNTTAGDNIYLFSSTTNPAVVFGIVDPVLDKGGNLIGGTVALTATIDSDLVNENNTLHMYVEQYESLEHPNENSHDETIRLNLNYFVTDDEGDKSNIARVQVQFRDDGPTIESDNAAVVIDDDDVLGADGNPDGVGDDAPENVTGTLSHNYGADEEGATTLLLDTGAPEGFTYSLNDDGTVLTVKQGGVNVMSITLDDTSSGNYTVTQLNPIKHPEGSDENNVEFVFNYRVTDGDKDTVDGTLAVSVDDDTPVVIDDISNTTDESKLPGDWSIAKGNIAADFGADGGE
ncbi:hypothetical protein WH96_20575, partial [Kiloniella spongiae]